MISVPVVLATAVRLGGITSAHVRSDGCTPPPPTSTQRPRQPVRRWWSGQSAGVCTASRLAQEARLHSRSVTLLGTTPAPHSVAFEALRTSARSCSPSARALAALSARSRRAVSCPSNCSALSCSRTSRSRVLSHKLEVVAVASASKIVTANKYLVTTRPLSRLQLPPLCDSPNQAALALQRRPTGTSAYRLQSCRQRWPV